MAENQTDERCHKKLRDYGFNRIVKGHKEKKPLSSVELVELYMNYLDDKNEKQMMGEQEFESFCHDFKRLLPKSKNEKLRGTGHLCLKEDLMRAFKGCRKDFNQKNKHILAKSGGASKNSADNYEVCLKDDEIGLEDLGRVVCVEDNYLLTSGLRKYFTSGNEEIPKEVCHDIFTHYDKNQSGWLSTIELMGLLRDIFCIQRMKEQMLGKPVSAPKDILELKEYADEMCIKFSTNLDGMLTYDEMSNLLNESKDKKKK